MYRQKGYLAFQSGAGIRPLESAPIYASPMVESEPVQRLAPVEPDLDENGVDLAQIREMLDLTPAERLLVVQNLVDGVAEIRALNGPRPVR